LQNHLFRSLSICLVLTSLTFCSAAEAARIPWSRLLKNASSWLKRHFQKDQYVGLSVGIVHDQRLVWSRHLGISNLATGQLPNGRTLYRIGSITKVFTSSLMMELRDRKKLRLDDPIRKKIPRKWRVALPKDPRGDKEMTFRHLATHTSGLPRMPINLLPKGSDPYNHFSRKALYSALFRTPLKAPIGARVLYSNLGYGLLGQMLGLVGGKPYETLLQERILRPLKMTSTTFTPNREQTKRVAQGYTLKRAHAPVWNFGALNPAGGLLSSLEDMHRFLALQHRAGTAYKRVLRGGSLTALHRVQRLLRRTGGRYFSAGVGLGWHTFPLMQGRFRMVMHNGAVSGFRSFVAFSPEWKVGVIVLANSDHSVDALGTRLMTHLAVLLKRREQSRPSRRLKQIARLLCARLRGKRIYRSTRNLFAASFLKRVPWKTKLKPFLQKTLRNFGRCRRVRLLQGEGKVRGRWLLEHRKRRKKSYFQALLQIEPKAGGRLVGMLLKSTTLSKITTQKAPDPFQK
jgi:CubicO group peptidase (beta-lactamase class C family)